VTDIAHEQQRAARQGQLRTVKRGILTVRIEGAGHGLAALFKGVGQVTPDQAQPVRIGEQLVLGIHRRDGVFHVADRGQRAFQQDIGNPQRIVAAHRASGIDHDFDVQAIVAEQVRAVTLGHQMLALPAFQRGLPTGDRAIEERAGSLDHCRAAVLVIAAGARRRRIERVGAVIGVVKAAPARVRGIEQEAGVEHRHDQLRPGHSGDFGIDVLRADLERRRFGDQIANLVQEGLVFALVERLACAGQVPFVNLRLKRIALGQQGAVLRHEAIQQGGKAIPEPGRILAQRCQHFGLDKGGQRRIDLQTSLLNPFAHGSSQVNQRARAIARPLHHRRSRGGMPALCRKCEGKATGCYTMKARLCSNRSAFE